MKLSIAEVRRRLPVSSTFTGEFIGNNGKICKPENKVLRRQVISQRPQEMESKLKEGPDEGKSTYLAWPGVIARLEDEAIILTCTGEDFLKITDIVL